LNFGLVAGGIFLKLNINGTERSVEAAPDTPLLWVLRDHLNLTGTKFGCGIAACGACAVHVDGAAVRSCVVPLASVAGKKIRTIEDLGRDQLTKLQQAWIRHQVPQCGYCQSGMLMAASALLDKIPTPTDADIDREITNICRCGTYQRIRAAIKDASTAAPGRARGIALHQSFGSIVAQVAEVALVKGDKGLAPKVHRVMCAIDCGTVINPDIVAAQMESGIVFGLTAALYGEITIKGGAFADCSRHESRHAIYAYNDCQMAYSGEWS